MSPGVLPAMVIVLISPVERHPFPLWAFPGEFHDMNSHQNCIHVAGLDKGGEVQNNILAVLGKLTNRFGVVSLDVTGIEAGNGD